jgi:hypothetical protein
MCSDNSHFNIANQSLPDFLQHESHLQLLCDGMLIDDGLKRAVNSSLSAFELLAPLLISIM